MYLIVSAFKQDLCKQTNARRTAVLLEYAANKSEEGGIVSGYSLVTGVYKNDREVSVQLDLTTASHQYGVYYAEHVRRLTDQECVALVDSGRIYLVYAGGFVKYSGDLEVQSAANGVDPTIDAWTCTTGPNALLLYSQNIKEHHVH